MKSAGMVLLGLFAWGACFLGEVSTPLADTIQIAAPTFIMDPNAGFSEIVDGTLRAHRDCSMPLFHSRRPELQDNRCAGSRCSTQIIAAAL
jgi:hypothetical protein